MIMFLKPFVDSANEMYNEAVYFILGLMYHSNFVLSGVEVSTPNGKQFIRAAIVCI